jgi:hypothetical protein
MPVPILHLEPDPFAGHIPAGKSSGASGFGSAEKKPVEQKPDREDRRESEEDRREERRCEDESVGVGIESHGV